MYFDPHAVQYAVGSILHYTYEGIARSVVVRHQPRACANHVEGLIRGKHSAAALFAAALTASAAMLATRLLAARLTAAFAAGAFTAGAGALAARSLASTALCTRVRHRSGTATVEYFHVHHITVVADSSQLRLSAHRQYRGRLLAGGQVSHLPWAKLANRLRPRLQVGFGLHVAQRVIGNVLHRRVDGLSCRIVAS